MSGYSERAQPYMDALAAAAFKLQDVRDWIVSGTAHAGQFTGAASLHEEQAARRRPMKQPFYCNYWCGRDRRCTCRVEGAKGLETDMMLFFERPDGRRLGVSIEVKAPGDRLRPGQAACYPLRAACWQQGHTGYSAIVPHDDWLTVILCPDADIEHPDNCHFDRVLGFGEAALVVPAWPA